jgi:hypothetical protein
MALFLWLGKQVSSSFCEQKEPKKLCELGQRVRHRPRHTQAPEEKKFFGSFFQKRTASLA